MAESWIVASARTPVGRFLGELSILSAPELGGVAISDAVSKISLDPTQIQEVIMGQVITAGTGQAPARQAARKAGIPDSVGCGTVNKVCGSGLYSVMLADRSIRCGEHEIVIAGGMECMSQAPHLLKNTRLGWKYGSQSAVDAIDSDGLFCPHGSVLMGTYAEQVAREYGIDRHAQDGWAMESHQRALRAQSSGLFQSEIASVSLANGQVISQDSGPRADTSMERLGKLRPVFDSKGTVTAGNSSTLSDGAAAVVVVNESRRQSLQKNVGFRIVASQVHASQPKDLFLAPVGAIERLLKKTSRQLENVDFFEINEAFASQTIACMRSLNIPPDKLNVHGGALALGHPIGCSGARVLVSLMHALIQQKKSIGVAALCLGGGEAVAMMIEADAG